MGEELVFNQWDTLVYLMGNEENKHWWLVEDDNGQVGYVPVSHDHHRWKRKAKQPGKRDTERVLMERRLEGIRDSMEKEKVTFSGSD